MSMRLSLRFLLATALVLIPMMVGSPVSKSISPAKNDACALADTRTVRLLVGLTTVGHVSQLNHSLEGLGHATSIVPAIRLAIVQVIDGDAMRLRERLREQSWVRYAQLDSCGVICAGPNDPEFFEQPALDRIGAPAAWATATGGTTVTVAVLDTGVDSNHEDLHGTLLPGRSFVPNLFSPAGQPDWADDNGHGTKIAGLIAARRDNAVGIAGMCRDCRILPIKVADASGHVRYGDLAQGIVFATDSGARIINISLAGRTNSEAVEDAIDYAREHGVLVVAAAGSAGAGVMGFPANHRGVLSVTATGETDLPFPDADLSHQTRIAAPGDPILSTIPFDRYGPSSGSSAAAALVSGTAAMLLSTRPDLTAKDIERILRDTADPLPMPGFDDVWDCGRLNAARAAAHLAADYRDLAIRRIRLFSAVARPGERVKGFVVVENRGSAREREARLDLTWMAGSAGPIRIQHHGKLNLKPGVAKRVNFEFTAPSAFGVHGIRGTIGTGSIDAVPANDTRIAAIEVQSAPVVDLRIESLSVRLPHARETADGEDDEQGEDEEDGKDEKDIDGAEDGDDKDEDAHEGDDDGDDDADEGDDDEPDDHAPRNPGFRFRLDLVNRGNDDGRGGEALLFIDGAEVDRTNFAKIKPGHRRRVHLKWHPPDAPEINRKVEIRVDTLDGDFFDGDNQESFGLVAKDDVDGSAGIAYPDTGARFQVVTDAPWRIDVDKATDFPVMLFVPSVRFEKGASNLIPLLRGEPAVVGLDAREFLVVRTGRAAGAIVRKPDGTPVGDTLYKDTPFALPSPNEASAALDDEGARIDDADLLQHNFPVDNIFDAWHRLLTFPLDVFQANQLELTTILRYQFKLTARYDRVSLALPFGAAEITPTEYSVGITYEKTLRILKQSAFPKIDDLKEFRYIDPHFHSYCEWSTLSIARKNFAGPWIMLNQCAFAMGLAVPNPRLEAGHHDIVVTDHNVFFSSAAVSGIPEEAPPSGLIRRIPRDPQLGASQPGINAKEFELYRSIYGTSAGEEVAVAVGETLAPHLLVYRAKHVDGPYGGDGPLGASLPGVLANLADQPKSFCYAAHPFGGITNWTQDLFDTARSADSLRFLNNEFMFKGYQFWNERDTEKQRRSPRGFEALDPYDPSPGFQPQDEYNEAFDKTRDFWFARIREAADFKVPPANNLHFVQKVYGLAGSDAHGDFNYRTDVSATIVHRLGPVVGTPGLKQIADVVAAILGTELEPPLVSNSAFLRCRTYAEDGLDGIRHGRAVMTDGPLIWFGVDANIKFDSGDLKFWHDKRDVAENVDGEIGGRGAFDGGYTLVAVGGTKAPEDRPLAATTGVRKGRPAPIDVLANDKGDFGIPKRMDVHAVSTGPAGGATEIALPYHNTNPKPLTNPTGITAYLGETTTTAGDDTYRCVTNPVYAVAPIFELKKCGFFIAQIPARKLEVAWEFPVSMKPGSKPHVFAHPLDGNGNSDKPPDVKLDVVGWFRGTNGIENSRVECINPKAIQAHDEYPGRDQYTFCVHISELIDVNGNALNAEAVIFTKSPALNPKDPPDKPNGDIDDPTKRVPDGKKIIVIWHLEGSEVRLSGTALSIRFPDDPEVILTPGSFTVINDTTATFSVTAGPGARIGLHDLEVLISSEARDQYFVVTYQDWLDVIPAPVATIALTPGTIAAGATVEVSATGADTNFDSTTRVQVSGAGATVSATRILDPTHLSFTLASAPDAPSGDRVVTVITDRRSPTGSLVSEVATAGFTLLPAAATPTISVSPTTIAPGRAVELSVIGTHTHFGATTQVAVGGEGLTVSNIRVRDLTRLSCLLTASANAQAGERTITVTTGGIAPETASASVTVLARPRFGGNTPPGVTDIAQSDPAFAPLIPAPVGPRIVAAGTSNRYEWDVSPVASRIQFPDPAFQVICTEDVVLPRSAFTVASPTSLKFFLVVPTTAVPGARDLLIVFTDRLSGQLSAVRFANFLEVVPQVLTGFKVTVREVQPLVPVGNAITVTFEISSPAGSFIVGLVLPPSASIPSGGFLFEPIATGEGTFLLAVAGQEPLTFQATFTGTEVGTLLLIGEALSPTGERLVSEVTATTVFSGSLSGTSITPGGNSHIAVNFEVVPKNVPIGKLELELLHPVSRDVVVRVAQAATEAQPNLVDAEGHGSVHLPHEDAAGTLIPSGVYPLRLRLTPRLPDGTDGPVLTMEGEVEVVPP